VKLLIASQNPKKLKELHEIFAQVLPQKNLKKITLVSLSEFPNIQDVEEDGKTFEENAIKKALGYAKQTGFLTLADDSGLCVDALDGGPGIFSARYAGAGKNDLDNCHKLIKEISSVPENKRSAHFECAVAIALPNRLIGTAHGTVSGVILTAMRGSHGFGYDPLFYYPPFIKTLAEVPTSKKHQISHRFKALKQAAVVLSKFLSDNNL